MPNIYESNFESIIECALLAGGPDACAGVTPTVREIRTAYGTLTPGGYRRRAATDYDEERCLIPEDVVGFVQATQPKAWAKLRKLYGERTRTRFLRLLAREVDKRGTLDVLRKGLRDAGARIRLAYFRPPTGLNLDLQTKYEANRFTVIRQFTYSVKDRDASHRKSIDLGLFLNGLPIFTAELKNPLTGQTYRNAIHQYKTSRSDPQEPLLAFRRCLAHFAVDPDEVHFTTQLAGPKTRFFPFNQGRGRGKGNPIPAAGSFATAYLWEEIWAKDSVLDLLAHFIHEAPVYDDDGKRTGDTLLIFPRYHQLDAVRKVIADARSSGPGGRYLIQHSAGSGKTFTIAWLAHQLTALHDAADQPVFDTIVVITDRRHLDQQLQRHVTDFEQTRGLVQAIDQGSRQLREALEQGKRIVISTLQKFPYISAEIEATPGSRFAVIIDEAHSSQAGEQSKHLKAVLTAGSLEEAAEVDDEEEDWQDRLAADMRARTYPGNASFFAFTATPKPKTLELFGTRREDGTFDAFHLYPMRQAIDEGFILDVLEHYTTYQAYWNLLKRIDQDPRYEKGKASALLRRFVELHPHAVEDKIATIVEHFNTQVAHHIDGKAKAMIVTRSRLHAVRYRLALGRYLKDRGYPYQAMVAFSGTVTDPDDGQKYTEAEMNGVPQAQTAATFEQRPYRFMVVANKFQTGFDEPLLTAMYVDKQLNGVRAVQTLSRLNRTHPGKTTTFVLDFANEAEVIEAAFSDYYETTILSEATDPHLLYDLERKLADFLFYTQEDLDRVAQLWYTVQTASGPGGQVDLSHPKIHNALQPAADRFNAAAEDEQESFRGALGDYLRLYAFLSQLLPFEDLELEKLYLYGRLLRKRLPGPDRELPQEVLDQVDLASYRLQQMHNGSIELEAGEGLGPQKEKGAHAAAREELLPLSEIVKILNEMHSVGIPEREGEIVLSELLQSLVVDGALADSRRVNTRDNLRLTFQERLNDRMQDMLDSHFKFYKAYTEDAGFAESLVGYLFEQYLQGGRA
jgi:type I restriction enzyme, R subunit